jgi:hypothetical protein
MVIYNQTSDFVHYCTIAIMNLLQARERRAHRMLGDGWCCFAVRAFYLLELPDATLNDQNTDFCTARARSIFTACAGVQSLQNSAFTCPSDTIQIS